MRPFPGRYNFSFGRYKWKTIWSLPTYQLTMRFLAHFPKSIFFSKVHRKWTKKDSDKRTTGASLYINVVSKPHIITLKKFSERVAIYCWRWGFFYENNCTVARSSSADPHLVRWRRVADWNSASPLGKLRIPRSATLLQRTRQYPESDRKCHSQGQTGVDKHQGFADN